MNTTTQEPKNTRMKRRKYFPSSFLIIVSLMLVFVVISWVAKAAGATTTIGTETLHINGLGFSDIFVSIWSGFVSKADVIAFIFAIGGMLGIVARTRAVDAGIESLIKKLRGKEILIVPTLMLVFGLGGTTYGMWEESIAFFPILIPIFRKAKFGPFIAVLTILLGTCTGCLASTINPFATGIAFESANDAAAGRMVINQGIMQGSRWIVFVLFEIAAITFVTLLAVRTQRGKTKFLIGLDEDKIAAKFDISHVVITFTRKRKITVGFFIFGFVFMILSYLPWGLWISGLDGADTLWDKAFFWVGSTQTWGTWGSWGFLSISGIFLLLAVVIFLINLGDFVDNEENKEAMFIKTFINGSKDMMQVCLLIATAAGLGTMLTSSNLGPWIANSVSGISHIGIIAFGVIIFLLSIFLSILVPSTSGFAAAFIPIFSQIVFTAFGSESIETQKGIIGLVVFAFIMSSGIVNLFSPTSAPLMAYTQFCLVPYNVWIRKVWKILVIYFVMALLVMVLFGFLVEHGTIF